MHNYRRRCLLMALLIVCWWQTEPIWADIFEECNAGNDQQFIASNRSCTHFILCNGEDSHEGECPEGDRFNAAEQMCELMEDLDCRTGQSIQAGNEVIQATSTAATTRSTSSATTTTSPVPKQLTTQAPTIESSLVTTINNIVEVVSTACPSIDNPRQVVLLAHDQSCTDYYICYGGKPIPMTCAPTLHFNAQTGKCDKAEVVKCLRSNIAVREQCKKHTVDIYPHPDNCNYFYFCRNGFLMLQQCPFFYGWDYEKRSCVAINQAKCYGRRRF